jgi:hypothetical protein
MRITLLVLAAGRGRLVAAESLQPWDHVSARDDFNAVRRKL